MGQSSVKVHAYILYFKIEPDGAEANIHIIYQHKFLGCQNSLIIADNRFVLKIDCFHYHRYI